VKRAVEAVSPLAFPSSEDYIRAVQSPSAAFRDAALQRARFVVDPVLQVPLPASGSAAVVFRAEVEGQNRALRFFTHRAADRERYVALGPALTSGGLGHSVVNATWNDHAILVGQRRWPMVDMEWVEGRTLDVYVAHLAAAGDARSLTTLAVEWRSLVDVMQRAGFAHGDLQHGNVLVDMTGALRLVDLDGSWTEAVASHTPPREVGHRNYQHPQRPWGRWMDTFPGLVVYAALLCLAESPSLWTSLTTDDKIFFSEEDLAPPFQTETWRSLERLHDPDVERVLALLRDCCQPGWTAGGSLADLLKGALCTTARGLRTTRSTVELPGVISARWWEATDSAAVAHPPPLPPPPKSAMSRGTLPDPSESSTSDGSSQLDPEWYQHTDAPDLRSESRRVEVGADGFGRLVAILVGIAAAWLVIGFVVWSVLAGEGDDTGIEGTYVLSGSQTACSGYSECTSSESVEFTVSISDCNTTGCIATSSLWDGPVQFNHKEQSQNWRAAGPSVPHYVCYERPVTRMVVLDVTIQPGAPEGLRLDGSISETLPESSCYSGAQESWRVTGTRQ
jgi:hypothetical protein